MAGAVLLVAILGACSSGSTPRSTGARSNPTAAGDAGEQGGGPDTGGASAGPDTGGNPGAGGEKGGGSEAAPTTFTHPTEGYSIDSPGPMETPPGGGAAYQGSNEQLRIDLLTGTADPAAAAASDASGRA
ncbi:MAG: hypothetical protein NVSMB32_08790 [Actinomycetota bacterium]